MVSTFASQLADQLPHDRSMGTTHLPGRSALERDTLRSLSIRSDIKGGIHLTRHILIIAATGALVYGTSDTLVLRIPTMILLGFAIVALFAPLHECIHRTAFRSPRINQIVAWVAGIAHFRNTDYYWLYHTWHHRYTQDPARDPELRVPKPRTQFEYWLLVSGLFYWRERIRELVIGCLGRVTHIEFIPPTRRQQVVWSFRAQLATYALAAAAGFYFHSAAPLTYWLLPAIMAQPIMRIILLPEHTGCSEDANGLTNTRTTLTTWFVRLLMWNMSYHAEHHLYPSIPFHALPAAHAQLREKLSHVEKGYVRVNRVLLRKIKKSAASLEGASGVRA